MDDRISGDDERFSENFPSHRRRKKGTVLTQENLRKSYAESEAVSEKEESGSDGKRGGGKIETFSVNI